MTDLQLIQSKIYEIRGQRVMLDRDLAAMYGVETKVLNQAVKRNLKRFEGDDFMFRLTKDETQQITLRSHFVTLETPLNTEESNDYSCLRSQFVTLNNGRGQHSKYLPYAFTELGVAMLSSVQGENTAAKRFTYVFGESNNYYNTPVGRFDALQRNGISFENIKDAFSVEALTKQFYQDLFEWYQWAVNPDTGITFPNNTSIEEDDREDIDIKIIRLITRLMFVWFIKQKDLVPDRIFDKEFLSTILKDFEALSATNGIV